MDVTEELGNGMDFWDTWHSQALALNVEPDLAQLGRQLLRDHAQHGLEDWILGSADDMPLMLDLAVQVPTTAHLRFYSDIAFHGGAKDDPDALAHEYLCQRFKSPGDVDGKLAAEHSLAAAIWREHGALQSAKQTD